MEERINFGTVCAKAVEPVAPNPSKGRFAPFDPPLMSNVKAHMKTLAELSFQYIWLIMFGTEDMIDLDYSVQCQESLAAHFEGITEAERAALIEVAVATRNRLLAEPDEHGYTPRRLVSQEQKAFLDAFISGEVFAQWQ